MLSTLLIGSVLRKRKKPDKINDFIHKLKIVLKELNETTVWLEIITQSQMIPIEEFIGLKKECGELCRIMSASVKTAQRHRKNNQ